MNIYPVLIDSQPAYLTGRSRAASLLLVPLGTGTLIEHLLSRFDVTLKHHRPLVLSPPEHDSNYRHRLGDACPDANAVSGWEELKDVLQTCEPSDTLLIIDPRCFPTDGFDFEALRPRTSTDPRWATHLVAFEKGVGTKEFASLDSGGRVRRIQRYYGSITWPFITGVAASLVPVSSGILSDGFAPASLWELRSLLTVSGIPSRNLALAEGAHDLSHEAGFLAASEHFILKATTARGGSGANTLPLFLGGGHDIHPTARMIGPVILHNGVILEENARVVGPSLIGAGTRIGQGAVIAQASLAANCVIPALGIVRHRALFHDTPSIESATLTTFARRTSHGEWVHKTEDESAPTATDRALYWIIKRALDVVCATFGLIVLSPILALIAALIRLDSRGSILYGHERESRDRQVFRCWKFRTMYKGAEAQQRKLAADNLMDGPQFKMARDPRVTRMGRFLRATNLDEIPQLLNVLVGEMSLVGPRPSPFRENQYCVPWREGRLSVRPGITGLWQVCRHDRQISDFHQWIEYDLLYVRHASPLLDLKIFSATILTLGGKRHVPLSWMVPKEPAKEAARLKGSD